MSPHTPPLRGSLPPEGADLARGGPSLRSMSPHTPPLRGPFDKLRTDGLPPEGADLARGGPAPDRMRPHTPPLRRSLSEGLTSLIDHEQHARLMLSESAWAYFNGGAADEFTLRDNQSAWQRIPLWPRVLQSLVGGHTRVQLLGRTLAHPIFVAPVAHQCLAHAHGEMASALAASALGAGFVLSTQASTPLETVAQLVLGEPDRGPLWFQLYQQPDRGFTRELVQRAEQAGYEALVLTVDAPVSGARDRERRAGFTLPPGMSAVKLRDQPHMPTVQLEADQSALFDDLLRHAPTWEDVAWLKAQTHLPVLLKGITHPADARQAVACGVDGLIVSNHGGRTLDTMPATATLLPAIAQAVAADLPLLVDGGIRRGTDVLKAIALGASAVLVGRPVIHGLANAGAQGVAHVIRLLRDELEIAMALSGCRTLEPAACASVLAPPA